MKRYLAVIAVGLLGAFLASDAVQANPPGAPAGKLAFKFNYHAVPPGASPNCGNGHNVYTRRGQQGIIEWTLDEDAPISIEDCLTASIDGSNAQIFADAAGKYTIFVRILGSKKNTNTLSICRRVALDDSLECELGSVDLSRTGLDRFRFSAKLFDDDLAGEFWYLDPGSGFRIAEIRLYVEP